MVEVRTQPDDMECWYSITSKVIYISATEAFTACLSACQNDLRSRIGAVIRSADAGLPCGPWNHLGDKKKFKKI